MQGTIMIRIEFWVGILFEMRVPLLLRPRRTVQADLRVFIKSTSASLSNRVSAPTGFLLQVIRTASSARV